MTLLNQAKVTGFLLVFLYQNLMGHSVCVQTIVKLILSLKQTHFPRIDDSIDNIGHAKYVTKVDRLKGFWQIPLTDRA